jgi:tetratricopeptide (TPR) repeat protein
MTPAMGEAVDGQFRTTSGDLAMVNLKAQIDGLERQVTATLLTISGRAELIGLIALRGQVLGRISDYELAEEMAEQLSRDVQDDGEAFLVRAQARARFHRFAEALTDLDAARRLGAEPAAVDAERAAVFQAIGRYDDALAIHRGATERRGDSPSIGALALLHAERGEVAAAESLFEESRQRFRGVSPFPLALCDFQRGLMWMAQGDLHRARGWFEAAHRRLPAYAPAQGHLAEVEAALGETEAALARLRPLTISSDDPDYAASLARILSEAGRAEEARVWREKAAARYDELIARRPEAFADHAAEFWLEAGADPDRALWLAQKNLEIRQTPRAEELHVRARLARESARAPPARLV